MKTKLTEMFGIEYPIVQSGMQWLAVPQLAAAVCNAGGIGTINVTCWPTLDEFADALDEMNSLTNKPYIVNISLAPTQRLDNEEIRKTIRLCGEKHVAAIETSAEDPREFIADIKSAGMRHFHKCPNYKVSMSMERKGLDGVIIAGYEVGGHPSADGVGTFVIARRCAADMKIPVIAAGGIADGHGLAAALALGASGVAMGTRFVCVDECPISDNHRQWVINHTEKDTVLCQKTIGSMMRVSKNNASLLANEIENRGLRTGKGPMDILKEQMPVITGQKTRVAFQDGNVDSAIFCAGMGMGLVHDVVPVKVLLDRMVKEAEAHEAEDKKRKEDAETRNQAEAFAYSTEKLVNDNKDKLSDDIVKEVTDKVNALKEALKGDDTEKVKTAQTELMTAAQKIGQVLYAQQGAEGAAAGADGAGASAGSASGSDDDTVEAEVVDDDDDKDNK